MFPSVCSWWHFWLFWGWVDGVVMRLVEVLMTIPSIYLLVALAVLPPGLTSTSAFADCLDYLVCRLGWAGTGDSDRCCRLKRRICPSGTSNGRQANLHHPPPRFAADGYLYNYLGNASSEFHRGGIGAGGLEFSSLTPRGEICYPWQQNAILVLQPWLICPALLVPRCWLFLTYWAIYEMSLIA